MMVEQQPNAELTSEIKQWMAEHAHFHSARRRDVTRLLAALEAAEQRVAVAEQDRDQHAAVVEQVACYCENQGDKFRHHANRIRDMLASAPANALREVKATS